MRRVAIILVVAACTKHANVDEAAAANLFDAIVLPDVPPGESDLTVDDRGKIWAIAERDRVASEIELHGLTATVVAHPIDGVPDGNDTESMAWLGSNQFALGMEGQQVATAGVLFAELRPDGHLAVTRTRMLSDDEIGVHLTKNHGAEALCGTGDRLLVGIEERGTLDDGARFAPIVRLDGDKVSRARLELTTGTGKLSALDCKFAPDGSVDFVGIERHYGVERVLHGTLPAHAPDGAIIVPTVAVDLAPVIHDVYNLEGIARLSDGRTVLINDNQGSHVDGPTKLFVLKR
ncbi:MAG TPA: esterase-like activity of phytase family protein [Kofleriaceae bacterium]|jgi:hypothetical protein